MKEVHKSKRTNNQLLLVVALFALVGIGAIVVTQAKATNQVAVFGASSCPNGIWTVDATLRSNVSLTNIVNVDVYDQTDNPAGYRKLASNVALTYNAPYNFRFNPTAGMRKDKIILTAPNANPAASSFIGEARVETSCAE